MKQQEGGDAGIELFISIPIHGSDPLFLRAMHRESKGEDFRSVKRQARSDMVLVGVSRKQAKTVGEGAKREMDREYGVVQKACYDAAICKNDMTEDRKQHESISSPSSSSSSSSLSSVSDLFTIDEKEIMEFIDERSKPRFRLLTELY